MSVYIGDVQTFAGVIADKPQVLKIGEETMEVFSAWEDYKYAPEFRKEALIAEIADVIQAACNLLAAIGVEDMRQPMQECYVRNKERGREYANDTFSAENDVTAQDVDANDSREQLEADVSKYLDYPHDCRAVYDYNAVIGWLDRQAAITANETNHDNPYVGLVRGKQWERTEIGDYYCGRCGWKVTDHDSYCPECGGALHKASNEPDSESDAPKSEETAENATSKCGIRDFVDSREKLEADVRDWAITTNAVFPENRVKSVKGFLDRQAAITHSIDAWNIKRLEEERESLQTQVDELQEQVNDLTIDRNNWRERFNKANSEKCDLQSRDTNQRHNNLLNRLREKGVVVSWDDSRSDYMVLLNNCDAARELKAENDGLKTRIESLRSKLSKMLDAASAIQHIGDLP